MDVGTFLMRGCQSHPGSTEPEHNIYLGKWLLTVTGLGLQRSQNILPKVFLSQRYCGIDELQSIGK